MPPKGSTYVKARSENDQKALRKVFRSHYCEVPSQCFQFKDDDFTVLKSNMDFFLDLWHLNPYHSEKALGDAVKASFVQCKAAVAKAIAKDIKANLNLMHYKKRSLTSGKKCPILKEFFDLLEDKQPQQTSSSSSLAPSSSSLAPFSSASAPVLPVKATPPSALAIAKLYGFSGPPELPPSQITVSDESLHEEEPVVVEAWKGYYFDYQAMCLVRFSADGKTEMSEMQPGPNGFALAKFSDASIQETTVANLELFEDMAVQKKPSMAKKRPAAALMSEADDARDCSETSEPCVDVAAELAKANDIPQHAKVSSLFASNKAMLGTGEVLKLGLFRDKSYITYKPSGAQKFTLLVGVSKEQAARNNKHHHRVMQEVWDKLRGYTSMPSKSDMKALVLTLLASKGQ